MNRTNAPITAVLIDDEEHCTDMLKWMLEQYCPHVQVHGIFNDPAQALKYLQGDQVDVIFLDIEMPVLNAFDLLRALGDNRSDIIFTTAYDEFAIKAIKHSALDYLLKPIDKDELINAVAKVNDRGHREQVMDRISDLLTQVGPPKVNDRLAVPTRDGLEMVPLANVLYARADDNYTHVHLVNGRKILISRTLKDVERDLPADRFFRLHGSHVVAIDKVDRYVRGVGGYVVLQSGEQLPVSRSKREELLRILGVH